MSTYRIDLDVQALNSQVRIAMHTGDEGHDIRVRLNASGVPYALEDGCFGILSIKDGDVPVVWDYMAVNGDELRYTTKAGLTNKAAQLVAEVKLFVAGECKLTTPSFRVYVDQTVVNTDDVVMNNQPSASAFEQLIYEGQSVVGDAKVHAEEAAASASDATTAQVAAETARDVAVQKAEAAGSAAHQVRSYAISASGSASKAEEQALKAAGSADAAERSASASAERANEAQSQAEKAAASAEAAAGSAGAAEESAARLKGLFGGASNALKKTALGQDGELEISDVSPLEHGLKVRLLGENILPWPTDYGVWSANEDGSLLISRSETASTSSPSTRTIATYTGGTLLPPGRYTLLCGDGTGTSNGARAIVTDTAGEKTTVYAYGERKATFTVTDTTATVSIQMHCNTQGTTTLSPVLVMGEEVPNYYIAPTRWEGVTVYCTASQDAEDLQSAAPDENGFVAGLTSLSPSMVLWCDGVTDGAGYPTIRCTYSRDINVAYEELVNAIIALGGVLG